MKVRTGGRTIEIPDGRMRTSEWKAVMPPTPPASASAPSPYRSKAESAFARSLEFDKLAGMIKGWSYEPLRFKLPGETNYYKMDFVAWGYADDPRPRFIEIKRGKLQSADRSLVKLKTAAGLNPWGRFMLYTLRRSTWIEREILP